MPLGPLEQSSLVLNIKRACSCSRCSRCHCLHLLVSIIVSSDYSSIIFPDKQKVNLHVVVALFSVVSPLTHGHSHAFDFSDVSQKSVYYVPPKLKGTDMVLPLTRIWEEGNTFPSHLQWQRVWKMPLGSSKFLQTISPTWSRS